MSTRGQKENVEGLKVGAKNVPQIRLWRCCRRGDTGTGTEEVWYSHSINIALLLLYAHSGIRSSAMLFRDF